MQRGRIRAGADTRINSNNPLDVGSVAYRRKLRAQRAPSPQKAPRAPSPPPKARAPPPPRAKSVKKAPPAPAPAPFSTLNLQEKIERIYGLKDGDELKALLSEVDDRGRRSLWREIVKPIHPDKGGNEDVFQKVHGLFEKAYEYRLGGRIRGKKDQPVPIIAHEGELVVPKHVVAGVLRSVAWKKHIQDIATEKNVSFAVAKKIALDSHFFRP